jgi:hypothetical protein
MLDGKDAFKRKIANYAADTGLTKDEHISEIEKMDEFKPLVEKMHKISNIARRAFAGIFEKHKAEIAKAATSYRENLNGEIQDLERNIKEASGKLKCAIDGLRSTKFEEET